MGVDSVGVLTEATRRKITAMLANYDDSRSAALPALAAAQKQIGYLPDEAMAEVADILELPRSEVGAVAHFYTMFYKHPVGEHVITLCATLSCALLGSERLVEYLSRTLKIKVGETTEDRKFTLMETECLGACSEAPVMMLDDKYYGNLTEEKLDEILRGLGWNG